MKQKRKSEFVLTVSHFKILQTVNELNKVKKYPTAKGVNNILQGKLDPENPKYRVITDANGNKIDVGTNNTFKIKLLIPEAAAERQANYILTSVSENTWNIHRSCRRRNHSAQGKD